VLASGLHGPKNYRVILSISSGSNVVFRPNISSIVESLLLLFEKSPGSAAVYPFDGHRDSFNCECVCVAGVFWGRLGTFLGFCHGVSVIIICLIEDRISAARRWAALAGVFSAIISGLMARYFEIILLSRGVSPTPRPTTRNISTHDATAALLPATRCVSECRALCFSLG